MLRTIRAKGKGLSLSTEGVYKNYSLDKPALHEAGYDSYLTAWVFQQLGHIDKNYE